MSAFAKALNTVIVTLRLSPKQIAVSLGNTLASDIQALADGRRKASFQDVRRLVGLLRDSPALKASLFQAYLEDRYGPEWLELLRQQQQEARRPAPSEAA